MKRKSFLLHVFLTYFFHAVYRQISTFLSKIIQVGPASTNTAYNIVMPSNITRKPTRKPVNTGLLQCYKLLPTNDYCNNRSSSDITVFGFYMQVFHYKKIIINFFINVSIANLQFVWTKMKVLFRVTFYLM